MNITPIEIRQKEFERHFRGYDKDEVNAFLHTLSQAWERLLQENREKSAKLKQAEKDIEKVREVEGSLFRTLKTAEDTSSEIVDKAQRAAEEIRQETERRQQEIINNAHAQADTIVANAEAQAEAIVRGVRERVEQLKQEAEEAESRRQHALMQLEELANRILHQVENKQYLPVDDAIEESQRRLAEAEQAMHARAASSRQTQQDRSPEETTRHTTNKPSSFNEAPEETTDYHTDETPNLEPIQAEPEEEYEPAWVSDGAEANPGQEPTSAKPKRGSFFDELD